MCPGLTAPQATIRLASAIQASAESRLGAKQIEMRRTVIKAIEERSPLTDSGLLCHTTLMMDYCGQFMNLCERQHRIYQAICGYFVTIRYALLDHSSPCDSTVNSSNKKIQYFPTLTDTLVYDVADAK
jgi:hypothetical protein